MDTPTPASLKHSVRNLVGVSCRAAVRLLLPFLIITFARPSTFLLLSIHPPSLPPIFNSSSCHHLKQLRVVQSGTLYWWKKVAASLEYS